MRALPVLTLAATACSLALLSACGGQDEPVEAQRISLDSARNRTSRPLPSPDTHLALWQVSEDGQAIRFGETPDRPLLSLECNLRGNPPTMLIIRHAPSRPGLKALFPVVADREVSRFALDAKLDGGEWRWEGELPATDEQLDLFLLDRDMEATLPGGGTLAIAASTVPGEFVTWCRAGGKLQQSAEGEAAETPDAGSTPKAAP